MQQIQICVTFCLMIFSFESTKFLWKPHSTAQRSLEQLTILLPGDWLAICLRRAAAAAACGAGTVTVGAGAPCFTVFVASIVLSAPCGMILFEDVGTEKQTNKNITGRCISRNQGDLKAFAEPVPLSAQLLSDKTDTQAFYTINTICPWQFPYIPMNFASKSQ